MLLRINKKIFKSAVRKQVIVVLSMFDDAFYRLIFEDGNIKICYFL